MSEPLSQPNTDARLAAIFQAAVNGAVRRFGVRRRYGEEQVAGLQRRVYVNAAGEVRIASPDDQDLLLPAARDDAAAAYLLATEVGKAAPEDAIMDLTEQSVELAAEMAEQGL
jgi:hypothetical protein